MLFTFCLCKNKKKKKEQEQEQKKSGIKNKTIKQVINRNDEEKNKGVDQGVK
jgi:hypothetical protein